MKKESFNFCDLSASIGREARNQGFNLSLVEFKGNLPLISVGEQSCPKSADEINNA